MIASYDICMSELMPMAKQESGHQFNALSITEVHALNPALCMPLLFLAGGILPGKNREALPSVPSERTKSTQG